MHQHTTIENIPLIWSFFGGKNKEREDEKKTFARVIFEKLHIRIDPGNIVVVYDYINIQGNIPHYILYAEVSSTKMFKSSKSNNFCWFTQKQIAKLSFLDQTKHDLIIAQRVISHKLRIVQEKLHPASTEQT